MATTHHSLHGFASGELQPITPPPALRTDPERGTGEFGIENLDSLEPLPEPESPQGMPDDTQRPTGEIYYLYGSKPGVARRLTATFGTEMQLLAYVRWATLAEFADGTLKFEQGTPLSGYSDFEFSAGPLTEEDPDEVPFNPTPSML